MEMKNHQRNQILLNYIVKASLVFKIFRIRVSIMKGIACRNVERYVFNHNREVNKNTEPGLSSNLSMENVLGLNSESIKGHIMFALTNEEMLYYSSEYFVVHNLISKESEVIKREGCPNHCVVYIDRFQNDKKNEVVFTIERYNHCLYVGRLEILGPMTEGRKEEELKNYNWSISKLTGKHNYAIQSISYHPQKNYLYLLTSLSVQDKIEKHLWVYDLKRQCMIMSPLIKPSISKIEISKIYVSDQPNEIYLMGRNYFRMWNISFTQKTIKQSNYRNIQRCLFDKDIIKVFPCHADNEKVLAILTDSTLVLIKPNELISSQNPPNKSIQQRKNKDNIEKQLQNSLNQIYKMKFMFDQEQNEREDEDMKVELDDIVQDRLFSCASDLWVGEQGQSIVVATKAGNLMTYAINNGQLKLINQLIIKKNYSFDDMTVSKKGEAIILSENQCQNLYIINKYVLNSEEKEEELKLFWGMGQINKENVVGIGSPAAHERMCTLGENNTLKLWSFKGKERKIIFQQKLGQSVNQIAFHPCGLLVAVNFLKEIKLMSLLPTGIYEVMSVKTNYNSVGLRYSSCGNFLVSNQQNLLIFYNPFTLKTLGYIEPPQLKSKIINFQITPEGNYIAYHTSDKAFYIHPLQLYSYNKYDTIMPVHTQTQQYTCFYFDSNASNNITNKTSQIQTVFIGCTEHKYMAIYKNYGKELVVEYPIEDCHIVSLCVADGWLFAATSKESIRVYKWPIRESQCEMEVIDLEQKAVKFKHPNYQEYFFWSDHKKITQMHKLGFTNKLVIAREGGIISIISYSKYHHQKFEQAGQRKKMTQIVNDTFFITKNETQKRNRLIQKTEGDILKIQNQISKQKSILSRKYNEECSQIQRNFQQKIEIQNQEKGEYLSKLKEENKIIMERIQIKQNQFQKKKKGVSQLYERKKQYEEGRNQAVQNSIQAIVKEHKANLTAKIDSHKKSINDLKTQYRDKVTVMRQQFEKMVSKDYPSLLSCQDVNKTDPAKERKCSLRLQKQKKFQPGFSCEINDDELIQLGQKVEEIQKNNMALEKQLQELKKRVKSAEFQDENLQKDFQKCLELYNSNRFSNLSLHSEVLKMRTQLLQRKEIMDNKQQVINVAFQERQKLQNYKQLVKGSLTKLHQRKQSMNGLTTEKQTEMGVIFSELSATLNDFESMKREDQRLTTLLQVYQKDKQAEEHRIQKAVNRLKELKRYLLLQGLTEDVQQKEMYVEQQNLLTSINFYKKRMSMQTLKQKKNKMLKKSALNLVLKQNKNLLQEVNHLREETINHEHEITNLGKKLGEAHRMISIESKLKDQKYEVKEQRNQLEAIRALFNNEIASYNQNSEQEIQVYDIQ